MEYKVMLVENGEARQVDSVGWMPQPSTIFPVDSRDLEVVAVEQVAGGGWIYVVDPKIRQRSS